MEETRVRLPQAPPILKDNMFSLILAILILTILPAAFFIRIAIKLYENYDYEKVLFWICTGVGSGFLIDALIMFLIYKPFV